MMKLEGTATNCQHTTRITGGGETTTRTRYITLFRIDGRPIRFISGKALSLADGDQVIVAGREKSSELNAGAIYNLTTQSESHSGIWNRVIKAVIMPVFGLFFTGILSFFPFIGSIAWYLYPAFIIWSAYLLWTAFITHLALKEVRPTA
ncbi:MAG: hypothetical protein P1U89_27080 [Verrucomicrobiales bacterium]|nr:hypothetical protein [Verrucomicrobiales bacterium]